MSKLSFFTFYITVLILVRRSIFAINCGGTGLNLRVIVEIRMGENVGETKQFSQWRPSEASPCMEYMDHGVWTKSQKHPTMQTVR
jgi:hypothetical protein